MELFNSRAGVWFGAWVAVGVGIAIGLVSFGLLVLVPSLVVAGLMASQPSVRRWAFGLPGGIGLLLLFIGYVNRNGPFNPLPWLGLGALFLLLSIAGQARMRAT